MVGWFCPETIDDMKKNYYAALTYMVLGLVAGLYYREFTKARDFTGDTQLSVMHTHLLALGMLVFLIVLALDKLFDLSRTKSFNLFFWFYNAGLVVTVAMMFVHGTMDVLGKDVSGAVPGIAGLGHILLTVGLASFFVSLRSRAFGDKASDESARVAVDA
ncbi:uncharacterized protein DUF2871 [Antricoccus suffuscus]|uniref:Uncharacterized protein DUF2871 n=2 Tax=Antricoccus suffuscus TaxID=1629062 RepID=A0A2T0ZVW8_9ACTN|nr:uncharacterized protein DUF2871 [Antricoccus suffuscus]